MKESTMLDAICGICGRSWADDQTGHTGRVHIYHTPTASPPTPPFRLWPTDKDGNALVGYWTCYCGTIIPPQVEHLCPPVPIDPTYYADELIEDTLAMAYIEGRFAERVRVRTAVKAYFAALASEDRP